MPITPSRGPVDSDADTMFATEVSNRPGAPRRASTPSAAATPSGPSPLLSEADALLALVPQLRSTAQIADVANLRSQIVGLLRRFDQGLRARGVGMAQSQKAHFVLCALLDEVAETMPWGAGGRWERLNPVTVALGARPGDSIVRQLGQLAEDSSRRDLRELIYVALALGFDARGRGSVAGAGEADQVRARLATLLKRKADPRPRPLSVRWQPAVGRTSAVASWLPVWVGTCVVAALLAVLYFWLALALASQSDRVYAQIAALRLPVSPRTSAAPAPQPRLLPLLGSAAADGLQVRDEIDRSIVTLPADALFEPHTANLQGNWADLLRPVAAALKRTPGQVLVLAHTGIGFEPSARFPSSWELSLDQAGAVRDALLWLGVPAARLRFDGTADREPSAAGGPDQPAAASGRVEIVLLAGR
ncbi:MAG TPA: type IVB secretion system protein IcmH/DotU [Burkholderiaceae bacterium]|jgi:type VI secretion system protein ImpK|nr:type IVB secretion system protein IcmH/DotU [Burkholderiaceae bacterium]